MQECFVDRYEFVVTGKAVLAEVAQPDLTDAEMDKLLRTDMDDEVPVTQKIVLAGSWLRPVSIYPSGDVLVECDGAVAGDENETFRGGERLVMSGADWDEVRDVALAAMMLESNLKDLAIRTHAVTSCDNTPVFQAAEDELVQVLECRDLQNLSVSQKFGPVRFVRKGAIVTIVAAAHGLCLIRCISEGDGDDGLRLQPDQFSLTTFDQLSRLIGLTEARKAFLSLRMRAPVYALRTALDQFCEGLGANRDESFACDAQLSSMEVATAQDRREVHCLWPDASRRVGRGDDGVRTIRGGDDFTLVTCIGTLCLVRCAGSDGSPGDATRIQHGDLFLMAEDDWIDMQKNG